MLGRHQKCPSKTTVLFITLAGVFWAVLWLPLPHKHGITYLSSLPQIIKTLPRNVPAITNREERIMGVQLMDNHPHRFLVENKDTHHALVQVQNKGNDSKPLQTTISAIHKTTMSPLKQNTTGINQAIDTIHNRGTYSGSSNGTCQFLKVNALDPSIMKLVRRHGPVNCMRGLLSLAYIDEPFLKINLLKLKSNPTTKGFLYCQYRSLKKNTTCDYSVIYGKWSTKFRTSIRLLDDDEYIQVECFNKSGIVISSTYTSRIISKEAEKEAAAKLNINHKQQFSPKETMNVLMVGLDGLSVQNFERTMPKTRNFLLRDLNAIWLEKYNKVGRNTFSNVLQLLTGQSMTYFHEKLWSNSKPFDEINDYFLWSEFQKAGYLTAIDLEERSITAFHSLKRGWHKQPVDFYTRPLTLAMHNDTRLKTAGRLCKGDTPSISIHNDYLLKLATKFNSSSTPYFAYSFLTSLTHNDQNKASAGDNLYHHFLQGLKSQNLLHNTMLIFFSDHGERFGSIRSTYNGMIESRLPIFFIALPTWFKSKHPEEWSAIQTNAKRLTSAYDLHATIRDILYFKSSSKQPTSPNEIGVRLFRELVPESRTCTAAGIPIEFCNCYSPSKVKVDDLTKERVASAMTDTMMGYLKNFRAKCQTLSPKSVLSVLKLPIPRDRAARNLFRLNADLYYVTIATTPGHGVFQAVVELSRTQREAKVIGSISRLDMYKGENDCITDYRIRMFCLCK